MAERDIEAAENLTCNNIREFPVEGVGDAAGDAGLGVAVAPQGNSFADRILETFRFQKCSDRLRD